MQNFIDSDDYAPQSDVIKASRGRAWRRYQRDLHRRHSPQPKLVQAFKPTKKWRHLYTRKVKLQRARQLGVVYPLISRSVYQRMADQEWQEVRTCERSVCL